MSMDRKLLGRYGEKLAADLLVKKGYTIVASGYRGRFGEIDLIARKGSLIAFVEVKTRQSNEYLSAGAAVGAAKQQRLLDTAGRWLADNPGDWQQRFDVVEVYVRDRKIRHIENAF